LASLYSFRCRSRGGIEYRNSETLRGEMIGQGPSVRPNAREQFDRRRNPHDELGEAFSSPESSSIRGGVHAETPLAVVTVKNPTNTIAGHRGGRFTGPGPGAARNWSPPGALEWRITQRSLLQGSPRENRSSTSIAWDVEVDEAVVVARPAACYRMAKTARTRPWAVHAIKHRPPGASVGTKGTQMVLAGGGINHSGERKEQHEES